MILRHIRTVLEIRLAEYVRTCQSGLRFQITTLSEWGQRSGDGPGDLCCPGNFRQARIQMYFSADIIRQEEPSNLLRRCNVRVKRLLSAYEPGDRDGTPIHNFHGFVSIAGLRGTHNLERDPILQPYVYLQS
ncbi:hypothetical protein AcV5_008698 [Taiwanofungus camphoratus]|nr:hypothetical protein AcV5_008698 [Antrodia cinnamomea]KAI0956244.1 hypothetical protein AcV7_006694 [Antrodia cinnamomea]